MPTAVLLPRPSAPAHRAPAAPLPCLQPQDHRGYRLGRGAVHRHRHHHRLLLHVFLLLLVPAPAAPAHPPARPGNPPVQLHSCSSPSSLPCGSQSWPYAAPAWLHPHGHVPPAGPCCPLPHVPLRPPCLQPRSTTTLRPSTAQLSRSISPRGDPCTCRRPAGPGWGPLGPPWHLGAAPAGAGLGSSRPSWGDPMPAEQGGPCAAHWALCGCLLPRLWVPTALSTRGGVPWGGSPEGHALLSPCTPTPGFTPFSSPPGLALNHVLCPQPCVVSVTLMGKEGGATPPAPSHEL